MRRAQLPGLPGFVLHVPEGVGVQGPSLTAAGESPFPELVASLRSDPLAGIGSHFFLSLAEGEEAGWACLALGAAAAIRGESVVIDLGLEQPFLHRLLGLEDDEGIVDLLLYGASLARVAKPTPVVGLKLITRGSPPVEREEICGHPRWQALSSWLKTPSSLIFLPRAESGYQTLIAQTSPKVILYGPEVALAPALADWVAELAGRGRVAALLTRRPGEPTRGEPSSRKPQPTARPARRRGLVWIVGLALVLVGGTLGVLTQPWGVRRWPEPAAPTPIAQSPPVPLAHAPVSGEATTAWRDLPYALQLAAFHSRRRAWREIARWRASGQSAYLAEVELPGRGRWQRVLVGTFATEAEAQAARTALRAEPPGVEGTVRRVSLALHLGDFEDREEALRRVAALEANGVSSYLVETRAGGRPLFRHFVGAFEDEPQGRVMEETLTQHGVPFTLLPRRG